MSDPVSPPAAQQDALGAAMLRMGAFALIVALTMHAALHTAEPWREFPITLSIAAMPAIAFMLWASLRWRFEDDGLRLVQAVDAAIARLDRRGVAMLLAGCVAGLALIAIGVLSAFPNSGDEYAFVMQAETYRMGRLYTAEPPVHDAFAQFRYLAKNGIWFSPYQAGWSAVMAAFNAVGAPYWLINPILGAIMIAVFFLLARDAMRRSVAMAATLAMVTSAFFLLNFASYFSHGLGALCVAGYALAGRRYLRDGSVIAALIAGACIGLLGFTRAFNAVVCAAPFAIALLARGDRRLGLIWFGLGGLPFVAMLAAANAGITGDPMLIPQAWYSSSEPIGAPSSSSLAQTFKRVSLMHLWTSPLTWPALGLALFWLWRRKKLDFVDFIAPTTMLGFLIYAGDGGNQYGPRYYFEAWPMMIYTMAKAFEGVVFAPQRSIYGRLALAALSVHLAFQVGYLAPRLAREHRVITERMDAFTQAREQGLRNAVVFLASNVGKLRVLQPQDLVRNGPVVGDESVTFARYDPALNAQVRAALPGRAYYVYACGELTPMTDDRPRDVDTRCPGADPNPFGGWIRGSDD